MRPVLFSVLVCAAISACTLPDFEVNQSDLRGAGGTSDSAMSGSGGAAGSAPIVPASNSGGSGGSGDPPVAALAGSGGAAGAGGSADPPPPAANDAGPGGSAPEEDREGFCIDYCTVFFQFCEDDPANTYDSDSDCVDVCRTSDWPIGDSLEAPGSIRCRLTHSGFAESNPTLHCMHAAEVPEPSCPP